LAKTREEKLRKTGWAGRESWEGIYSISLIETSSVDRRARHRRNLYGKEGKREGEGREGRENDSHYKKAVLYNC